ncbi:beta-L-arabinofuranosidase domain-containing protein [Streptomyces sp. 6N223]|uniref:beta-L-arabinofuranosidase domain-containing protein n=1 Tax=Streptomyces sp. 6N223 TaxID=3457412 RepID=UPI003FD48F8A
MSPDLNRRQVLLSAAGAAGAAALTGVAPRLAAAASAPPSAKDEVGVVARAFGPGRVRLAAGRWQENTDRTVAYLRFVDVDRLLYVFRANHGVSTGGSEANGGWDAPDFPFRSHMQGHFLTAWAQVYAATGDTTCRDKAAAMVAGLAECQANNGAAGFSTGYLSGFPESDFTALEDRTLSNGNVPYYAVHKTLAGLLDVWRYIGDEQARDVLLALAGWVDWRTGRLSYEQTQAMLGTEFGGMSAVLTDIHQQTGDDQWLAVAQRFDHAAVLDPLAAGRDQLNGLHANTQVPKAIGCAREYKATGTQRYLDIARTFWDVVTTDHTYAIGGNSQAEHFREPGAIAAYLAEDTCESCNTYNMLKLTRELFTVDPARVAYADYHETALLNQMLGQQDPESAHGHITYFTPLNPGGRRGVGPAWGGGTWSTDYDSFWCCQGTGIEIHTNLTDGIYFEDDAGLYVSLFIPSTLDWTERGTTVTQTTDFPAADTTTLTIGGTGGDWALRLRIPAWTENATISVNGEAQDVAAEPGSWATVERTWADGDTVTLTLPMRLRLLPTPDDPGVQAVTYGPVVLSGAYGDADLGGRLPALDAGSIAATDTPLTFTATADGSPVTLIPFHDNHHQNYTVYWGADPARRA